MEIKVNNLLKIEKPRTTCEKHNVWHKKEFLQNKCSFPLGKLFFLRNFVFLLRKSCFLSFVFIDFKIIRFVPHLRHLHPGHKAYLGGRATPSGGRFFGDDFCFVLLFVCVCLLLFLFVLFCVCFVVVVVSVVCFVVFVFFVCI